MLISRKGKKEKKNAEEKTSSSWFMGGKKNGSSQADLVHQGFFSYKAAIAATP